MSEGGKPWKYPTYEHIDITPRNEKGEVMEYAQSLPSGYSYLDISIKKGKAE